MPSEKPTDRRAAGIHNHYLNWRGRDDTAEYVQILSFSDYEKQDSEH